MAETTYTDVHANATIHQIKLPNNTVYDIHDKYAVHGPEDLGKLGLASALVFKGIKATVADLPSTNN
jgi:hypothetical protein